YAVEVFPAVPVMPMTLSRSVGCPYTVAAASPSTARGSSTTSTGTPPGPRVAPAGSVRTATAPAAMAWPANCAPCPCAPGRPAYRSPGRTEPLSWVIPDTVTSNPSSATTDAPTAVARPRTGVGATVLGRG